MSKRTPTVVASVVDEAESQGYLVERRNVTVVRNGMGGPIGTVVGEYERFFEVDDLRIDVATIQDVVRAVPNVLAASVDAEGVLLVAIAPGLSPDEWVRVGREVRERVPTGIRTDYAIAGEVMCVLEQNLGKVEMNVHGRTWSDGRAFHRTRGMVATGACLDEAVVEWDRATAAGIELRSATLETVDEHGRRHTWKLEPTPHEAFVEQVLSWPAVESIEWDKPTKVRKRP